MAIEVRTNRTARERLEEWQSVQATLWEEIERMATLYSELASLTTYDEKGYSE